MPAPNAPPLEAAVPGRTRRRAWKHPELRSHSLLVLTLDRMHLAPLAGDPKPETVAAVGPGRLRRGGQLAGRLRRRRGGGRGRPGVAVSAGHPAAGRPGGGADLSE